ncbi:hypothetical protein THICB2_630007 [Thiomonas sp. CB2]|nr:hypothetical protein THICB2_630007 [Thiomonas sp. CB2]
MRRHHPQIAAKEQRRKSANRTRHIDMRRGGTRRGCRGRTKSQGMPLARHQPRQWQGQRKDLAVWSFFVPAFWVQETGTVYSYKSIYSYRRYQFHQIVCF